jgi:hypothetical protein
MARGLLPPVGNFTLPRSIHLVVYIASIQEKKNLVNEILMVCLVDIFQS